MVETEIEQHQLVIQRNNEAVEMIQRGEFAQAKRQLMDALQDFRVGMARYVAQLEPGDSADEESYERLSLDEWMSDSREALHTPLAESATSSYFVYPKGILIPTNFFQDNQNRYCHVDVTAAIASVIFFNQGLACQLAHIRAQPESRDNQSLQTASELYRLSIQGTRHMQLRASLDVNTATNANFLTAAMNNLAVSERIYNANAVSRPEANQYFETLRRFLLSWRPSSSDTPEEVLWNCYVENVLRGLGLVQSNYCASLA